MAWTLLVAILLGAAILLDRRRRLSSYPPSERLPRILLLLGGVMVWATGVVLTLPPPDALTATPHAPADAKEAPQDDAPDGEEAKSSADPGSARLLSVAHEWVGEDACEWIEATEDHPAHIRLADGWIVSSAGYADEVTGFGGPMELAVWLDTEGILRGVRILTHNETPWYVEQVKGWMDNLVGKPLFADAPLGEVEIVTGATVTSEAVVQILRRTGRDVQAQVEDAPLAWCPHADAAPASPSTIPVLLLLVVGGVGAMLLRRWPTTWGRRLWLLAVVVVAGVWLNRQYALVHVGMLFGGGSLLLRPVPLLVFLIGMPLLVVLVENVHCGWLCPFGALQELVGDLSPVARRRAPTSRAWQVARMVKYVLLLAVLITGVWLGWEVAFGYDILDTAFAYPPARLTLALGGAALLASGVYPRFWCRVLCPTGAFFSLLGGVQVLRRWIPAPWVRECDLGVRHAKDLDCLCCDRCRSRSMQRVSNDG